MADAAHWDDVYAGRGHTSVSWFQDHPADSLDLIGKAGLQPDERILDVGAGASHLADALIAQGHRSLVLADISAHALAVTKQRLAGLGDVKYLVGDVLKLALPEVSLWHDRALFHFLTTNAKRAIYRRQAVRCVRPGGYMVIATFAADGPERCSGLSVTRYSPVGLAGEFGPEFAPLASRRVTHVTPAGQEQAFTYCLLQRTEDSTQVNSSSKGDGTNG